jgi:hypothetical protein
MATSVFFPRSEKASWGIPCNQNAQGEIFVGKGMTCPFATQFSPEMTARVLRCLARNRGDRNGHFWVNFATLTIMMQVGDSASNRTEAARF